MTCRVFRSGIYRWGEMGSSGTNEMAGRGLLGTRSMVFSNINDVTMFTPHGMILEWGNPFRCVCKNGVVVNATWTFFSRSRFRRWGAYLVSYLRSDWTVGILRKLSICPVLLMFKFDAIKWFNKRWRDDGIFQNDCELHQHSAAGQKINFCRLYFPMDVKTG